MPAKPMWYARLPDIIRELEALPRPQIDRSFVEYLFRVKTRRAQVIMQPCVSELIGTSGVVDRIAFIRFLRALAEGDDGRYELVRRKKVAATIHNLIEERIRQPQVLVEAPVEILSQEIEHLPAGVSLGPGRIVLEFDEPQQALEKLLALAMAIGNDLGLFERLTRRVGE